jgi:hypothetical protein
VTEQVIMKMPQIFGWGGNPWVQNDSLLSFQDGAIRINGTNWPAGSITQPTQAGTQDKATVEFLDLNGWLKITDHQSGQELGGVYGVTGPQSVTFTPLSDAVDLWFGYAGDSGSVRVQNLTTTLLSSTSPPNPPPPTTTLTASGPVKSTRAGQVFEYLDITATNGTAVEILHNNVTVRFCRIRHGAPGTVEVAQGIRVHDCASPTIQTVEIEHVGPFNPSDPRQAVKENRHNIEFENVSGLPWSTPSRQRKGLAASTSWIVHAPAKSAMCSWMMFGVLPGTREEITSSSIRVRVGLWTILASTTGRRRSRRTTSTAATAPTRRS